MIICSNNWKKNPVNIMSYHCALSLITTRTLYSIYLDIRSAEGYRYPWHLAVVIFVGLLVSVRTDKDNLDIILELVVEFCQYGRESPTRWTPVCRKIQTYKITWTLWRIYHQINRFSNIGENKIVNAKVKRNWNHWQLL